MAQTQPDGFQIPSAQEIARAVKKGLDGFISGTERAFGDIKKDVGKLSGAIDSASAVGKDAERLAVGAAQTAKHGGEALVAAGKAVAAEAEDFGHWYASGGPAAFVATLLDLLGAVAKTGEIAADKALGLSIETGPLKPGKASVLIYAAPPITLWYARLAMPEIATVTAEVEKLNAIVARFPKLEGPQSEVCPGFRQKGLPKPWEIHRARTLLRFARSVTRLGAEIVPRDLSVTAVAVVGGGTEVTGHPFRIPFLLAGTMLDLADETMTRYLAQQAACQGWRKPDD